MPVIAIFFGISIHMYFIDNKRHKKPHIHAEYQNKEAVISIPDGKVLEGTLPPAKLKLVIAWVEIHKEDLLTDWELAVKGQNVLPIEPLR
jgi:Domain of unknown function (DUF4160)